MCFLIWKHASSTYKMNTNDILYYYIMFRFQELAEVSRSNYWIVKRNLAINKKQSWIVYITSYIFFLCIVYIILYVSTVIHIHTDKPTKRWTFYTKLTSERTFSPRFFWGPNKKILGICITGSRVGFWIPQSCSNSVKDVLHSGPRSDLGWWEIFSAPNPRREGKMKDRQP